MTVQSQEHWLATLTDAELVAVATELEERAEQFAMDTRTKVNDELRRRKMPVLGVGRSRH